MRKEIDFKKSEKLHEKMITLSSSIEEEFDILEAVEDHIKDIFSCDLDCSTCTENERGVCMQTFKKANFYWIRKIVHDESMLQGIVEKMDEYRDLLKTAAETIRENMNIKIDDSDDSDEKLVDVKPIDFEKRRKEIEKGLKGLYT